MADAERPVRPASAEAGRREGGRRVQLAPMAAADDVARRLTALEREVEEALGASTGTGGPGPVLKTAVDEALTGFTRARRWVAEEGTRLAGATGLADAGLQALYRYWWRAEVFGIERIPARGRALLVANRSASLLPYEAFMLEVAIATEHPAERRAHALVDGGLEDVPLVGPLLRKSGASPTPAALRQLLEADEVAIVFPEGRAALAKPWAHRYRLARFGHSALLRVAIETGAPIVPVAVIGAEEVQPVLYRIELGRALGLPAFPLTPTFPWLGPLGLLPLPTKWRIHVGEPLDTKTRFRVEDAHDPAAVRKLRDEVRERLQGILSEGVRRRRSVFLG
jgi:1-acyl-sn-glycerol-3-phosphate acyltransferase